MFRAVLLALTLAFGAVGAANAGEADIPPPVAAVANQFFTQLQDEKYPEAFHAAFKSLEKAMGTANIDAAALGIREFTKDFGSITKWSVLRVNVYNSDFIEVTYCVEYDIIPIFFTLQFYNAGGGWHIVDVKANTFNKARDDGLIDGPRLPARAS